MNYAKRMKKKFEGVHTIEIDIFRFAIERVLLIIRYMHISLKETNCASLLLFAVVLLWSYVKWWSTGIVSAWHRQRLLYLLGFLLFNIIFKLKKSFFTFHFENRKKKSTKNVDIEHIQCVVASVVLELIVNIFILYFVTWNATHTKLHGLGTNK